MATRLTTTRAADSNVTGFTKTSAFPADKRMWVDGRLLRAREGFAMRATLRNAAIAATAVTLLAGVVGCQSANRVANAGGVTGGLGRTPAKARVSATSQTRQVSGAYSDADDYSRLGGTSIGSVPAGRRETNTGPSTSLRSHSSGTCSSRFG